LERARIARSETEERISRELEQAKFENRRLRAEHLEHEQRQGELEADLQRESARHTETQTELEQARTELQLLRNEQEWCWERLSQLKREVELASSSGGTTDATLRELDAQVSELQRLQAEHLKRDELIRKLMHHHDASRQSEPEDDEDQRKI